MTTRSAIVTGATRGIGHGIFLNLARQGCNVATVYHKDETAAVQFKKSAEQFDVRYAIDKIDIRDLAALDEFVARTVRQFGAIDYLVNNVGIDDSRPIHDLSLDEWRRSQDIILNAPFVLCKAVLPFMRAQGFGRIVNIGASSRDYLKGAAGLAPFGVHKAALSVLTKTLALEEIGHGITVNMVAPGSTAGAGTLPEEDRIAISTIPFGRRVLVDEVVAAVMYFLADSSASVTGQFIGVNGGLST